MSLKDADKQLMRTARERYGDDAVTRLSVRRICAFEEVLDALADSPAAAVEAMNRVRQLDRVIEVLTESKFQVIPGSAREHPANLR